VTLLARSCTPVRALLTSGAAVGTLPPPLPSDETSPRHSEVPSPPDLRVLSLFVEPWAIGRGYGKRLWRHAVEVARTLGCRRLRIESDPFAEAFYHAMGAERIGEAPSEAIPGRMIPLLTYWL
jgi:GNAT superfamily N-acetyltransferase